MNMKIGYIKDETTLNPLEVNTLLTLNHNEMKVALVAYAIKNDSSGFITLLKLRSTFNTLGTPMPDGSLRNTVSALVNKNFFNRVGKGVYNIVSNDLSPNS